MISAPQGSGSGSKFPGSEGSEGGGRGGGGEGGAAQRKHKTRAAPQAGPSKTAQNPGPTPTLQASQAISLLGLQAWRN